MIHMYIVYDEKISMHHIQYMYILYIIHFTFGGGKPRMNIPLREIAPNSFKFITGFLDLGIRDKI